MSTSKAPPEDQSMQELPPDTPAIDMQDWPNDWLQPKGEKREVKRLRPDARKIEHQEALKQQLAAANAEAAKKRAERVERIRMAIRSAKPPD